MWFTPYNLNSRELEFPLNPNQTWFPLDLPLSRTGITLGYSNPSKIKPPANLKRFYSFRSFSLKLHWSKSNLSKFFWVMGWKRLVWSIRDDYKTIFEWSFSLFIKTNCCSYVLQQLTKVFVCCSLMFYSLQICYDLLCLQTTVLVLLFLCYEPYWNK